MEIFWPAAQKLELRLGGVLKAKVKLVDARSAAFASPQIHGAAICRSPPLCAICRHRNAAPRRLLGLRL
jgi:hypothetical protein